MRFNEFSVQKDKRPNKVVAPFVLIAVKLLLMKIDRNRWFHIFPFFLAFRLISARAKKLNSSVTPQPAEHRATVRRTTNTSQSQRKCHPRPTSARPPTPRINPFHVRFMQPHREVHRHRPDCTVWAINRRTSRRAQFRRRRLHQSFHVHWSIRVKRAPHARTTCTTRFVVSATCPPTAHGDRSGHRLFRRDPSLPRKYCRRVEKRRAHSPTHW